jgi:hypothetical protein
MRNIKQYPVTYEEKQELIESIISFRSKAVFNDNLDAICGDMTLVILREIAEDLWHLEDLKD